jgi:protein ImuB
MFACLYRPPHGNEGHPPAPLAAIAADFSPRFEQLGDDLVSLDVSGLDRLLGPPAAIGAELARDAAARGGRVHVALASTHTAAMVVARARPGLTVVPRGGEAAALAPLPIGLLEQLASGGGDDQRRDRRDRREPVMECSAGSAVSALKSWGIRTLGELAALPPADLTARLGRSAAVWQAIARGEDRRPLVPTDPEERFDATLELEWPIDGLEPLSFVLTRLLEPLSTRLERRDRGAAVLHVRLQLTRSAGAGRGRELYARRLELPAPLRDVRTLRTLALLDLESHPPPAAVDAVTIVIDPTPGRIVQHTLFTRAHPTPEQLSTLVARLGALIGQDRIGAPALIDTDRPGAFAMRAFRIEREHENTNNQRRDRRDRRDSLADVADSARAASTVVSALRRCRQPVPARVVTERDRPVRVTTDRRGFGGGDVTHAAGPWRTSGDWWAGRAGRAGEAGRSGDAGTEAGVTHPAHPPYQPHLPSWNRDEWDVALGDDGVYRIFRDRDTDAWFIDGIFD